MAQLKDVEQILCAIWLALFDPAFQPPKHLLNRIQKGRIGGQEEELELEIAKPLAWDPASHVYMGKDIPNFIDFVEGYVIKYNNISPPSVIPPDVLLAILRKFRKVPLLWEPLIIWYMSRPLGPRRATME